jgi:hypothetical protein
LLDTTGVLPGVICHATSSDCVNWIQNAHNPVVTLDSSYTEYPDDQIADPWIEEIAGKCYLYVDCDRNPSSFSPFESNIAVLTYGDTLERLLLDEIPITIGAQTQVS